MSKKTAPTLENAKADIGWLLSVAIHSSELDDEDDQERVNEIAKRWGLSAADSEE